MLGPPLVSGGDAVASAAITEMIDARTADWSDHECVALGRVVDVLRPSPRHLRDILDWLDDIATRDAGRPGAVLADPGLSRLLAARGSAPDRLKRWKEALRRLRYPRLVAREAEATTLIRGMALGPAARIQLPPALEGGALTVTLTVTSADALAQALARLDTSLRAGDIARLFGLLDEL